MSQYSLFGKPEHFYHGTLRAYVSLFGSLFDELYIQRTDGSKRNDFVKVPIMYGRGNRYEKVAQGEESREQMRARQNLPCISYTMETYEKDDLRKTNPHLKLTGKPVDGSAGLLYRQKNRVPYNFGFELVSRTRTITEALQVVEQIVPAFHNHVTVKVIDNSQLGDAHDIIIRLDSFQETSSRDDNDSDTIEYTFNFTLQGFMYASSEKTPLVREVELIALVGLTEAESERVVMAFEDNKTPIQPELVNVLEKADALGELGGVAGGNRLDDASGVKTTDHRGG